ncbi:MAG: D-alanyl-D-alanine carboxypeptidase [Clostridia bacterium]|nr:D-alanyl-D-alanine carboxypeptidase [Clostridia bacterium]
MKRRLLCIFLLLCCLSVQVLAVEPPAMTAKAALLYEASTDTVLYALNADQQMYPASTTKLMTAALAMEYGNPEDTVTVRQSAIDDIVSYGNDLRNSVYFLTGEQVQFMDMLDMLLVYSNNTAANILAEHVAGDIQSFVDLMNSKAQELGCTGTNFVNTHGLHVETHYTTANDLLKIAQYAMSNEKIVASMQKASIKTPVTNKHKTQTTLSNTNLLTSTYKQVGLIGGKTGSTTAAGYCLVAACQEDDKVYYSVLLDCDTTTGRFSETKSLFKFGKESFSVQTLLSATEPVCEAPVRLSSNADSVMLVPEHSISALLPNDFDAKAVELDYSYNEGITAPVAVGDVLGKVTVRYNGHEYGQINLVAASKVERNNLLYFLDQVTAFFSGTVFKVILIAVIVLIVLLVGYIVLVNKRRKRRNRSSGGTRRKTHGRYKGRH